LTATLNSDNGLNCDGTTQPPVTTVCSTGGSADSALSGACAGNGLGADCDQTPIPAACDPNATPVAGSPTSAQCRAALVGYACTEPSGLPVGQTPDPSWAAYQACVTTFVTVLVTAQGDAAVAAFCDAYTARTPASDTSEACQAAVAARQTAFFTDPVTSLVPKTCVTGDACMGLVNYLVDLVSALVGALPDAQALVVGDCSPTDGTGAPDTTFPTCVQGNVATLLTDGCTQPTAPGPTTTPSAYTDYENALRTYALCVSTNLSALLAGINAVVAGVDANDLQGLILSPSTPTITVTGSGPSGSQQNGYVVAVSGDATSSQAGDATISIATTDPDCDGTANPNPDTDLCAESVFWNSNGEPTTALTANTAAGYTANVQYTGSTTSPVTIDWTVTVSQNGGTGTKTVSVTYDDAAATNIGASVSDTPGSAATTGTLAGTPASPGSATPLAGTFIVQDANGNTAPAGAGTASDGQISDAGFTAALKGNSKTLNVPGSGITPGTVAGDSANVKRQYAVSLALPARAKDGDYTLDGKYTNPGGSSSTASFTAHIDNVAPTLSATGTFTASGNTHAAGTSQATMTLDDLNMANIDGTAVTELSDLTVTVRPVDCDAAVPVALGSTTFQVSFPAANRPSSSTDGGSGVMGLSLVSANAAISGVKVKVDWFGSTPGGTYAVCGVLGDGALDSGVVTLGTITLTALNTGFNMAIDDGGNGLTAGTVAPGASASTELLRVSWTGTTGAASLALTVGDFGRTGGGGSFNANGAGLTASLCNSAGTTCSAAPVAADSGGALTLHPADLPNGAGTGVGFGAGNTLFVKFTFTVPQGTAAGAYKAPVTVVGSDV
jgi:hypothetical protein